MDAEIFLSKALQICQKNKLFHLEAEVRHTQATRIIILAELYGPANDVMVRGIFYSVC